MVLRTYWNVIKNWQGSKTLVNASKIKEHIFMNQHTGTLDDFTTMSMGGDNELLEIKENIMITILKPILNDKKTYNVFFYLIGS